MIKLINIDVRDGSKRPERRKNQGMEYGRLSIY
jgi:hypothetical protein